MQNDQRLLNRPKSYKEKAARASFNSINSVILDSRVPVINSSSNILGSQTTRSNKDSSSRNWTNMNGYKVWVIDRVDNIDMQLRQC